MRRYLKVADAVAGIGWTRAYWTRPGVLTAGRNLEAEFGSAVWVYTPKEKKAYDTGKDSPGIPFDEWAQG